MSQKPNTRIWPGDYAWPNDRTPAQRAFFISIQERARQVMVSLRDHVLPVFNGVLGSEPVGDRWFTELYPFVWDWAKGHHLICGERLLPLSDTCRGLSENEAAVKCQGFTESPEQTFFFSFAW